MTQNLWDTMNEKVLNFTHSVTLKSLMLDQLAKGVKIEQKALPLRGVFEKPAQLCVRPDVPNSVFVLSRTFRTPSRPASHD